MLCCQSGPERVVDEHGVDAADMPAGCDRWSRPGQSLDFSGRELAADENDAVDSVREEGVDRGSLALWVSEPRGKEQLLRSASGACVEAIQDLGEQRVVQV